MGSTKLRDSFPASATGMQVPSEQVQESFFCIGRRLHVPSDANGCTYKIVHQPDAIAIVGALVNDITCNATNGTTIMVRLVLL
jgi:hypothetical protein